MKHQISLYLGPKWIDLVDPSESEIQSIAADLAIPEWAAKECLDPEHLPKAEQIGKIHYVILRGYDEEAAADADTIQGLTRKVAVFWNAEFVLTVHRKDQPHWVALRERVAKYPLAPDTLVGELMRATAMTFDRPLDRLYAQFERLETQAFRENAPRRLIEESYVLKRQASLLKRLLRLTLDTLPRLRDMLDAAGDRRLRAAREVIESSSFYAEDLVESVNHLLNLHLSLQAHRQNEVVRVLTVFSVFFLPLSFIAGVYGMNFENMPELKHPWGYWGALALMAGVVLILAGWFYRKGWLRVGANRGE